MAVMAWTTAPAAAQAPARLTGPVIESFGATFDVPPGSFMPSRDAEFKVKFDVSAGASDPKGVVMGLDTVARFINMHVRAGVPPANIKAAVVLHGTAAAASLTDAGYRSRHGISNPNLPLLEALSKAGVRIYLCGQSAAGRGIKWDEIAPVAKVALSAMTVHAELAREGYTTNPF